MKTTYYLIVLLAFLNIACTKESKEVDLKLSESEDLLPLAYARHQSQSNTSFADLLNSVSFCKDTQVLAYIEKTGKRTACSESAQQYIKTAGFPLSLPERNLWEGNWQKADQMFVKFRQSNKAHNEHFDALRWHFGQFILQDLELLGESSPEATARIYFYTKEMLEAGSYNLDFLNYCIQTLQSHYPTSEIQAMAKKALDNYERYGKEVKMPKQYENNDKAYEHIREAFAKVIQRTNEAKDNLSKLSKN